ncbi:MAG TPA: flagellar biosynthesis repressor FlbT [Azospirillaceae bacterium]|nr:flagellar biosynthesis repressor FlbT [Azospirillaceae bacterium]
MPLRIKLRADEKVIINGALISARQNTALIVHNHVSLLRERQILPPDMANTPARRIYFAIQCAYVAAPEEQQQYRDLADRYVADFKGATSSQRIQVLLDEILEFVSAERYYEALRGAQEVVRYEDFVLKQQSWEHPND